MATKKKEEKADSKRYTLRQIWNAQAAINKLASADMPVKSAYWVHKLLKRLMAELEEINTQRESLVKKLGVEQADRTFAVQQDKLGEFLTEFNALLDTEIKLDVRAIAFESVENVQLTPAEFGSLEAFLTQPTLAD
jgi:hypothetical protein